MLPRWHILWGAVFVALVKILIPNTPNYSLALIFFSTVFIDFDHYLASISKTNSLSLKKSLQYYREHIKFEKKQQEKGIKEKGHFFLFHTLEFHFVIAVIGLYFKPFVFILIGMILHSILDLISMANRRLIYRREFLLTKWIMEQTSKKTSKAFRKKQE